MEETFTAEEVQMRFTSSKNRVDNIKGSQFTVSEASKMQGQEELPRKSKLQQVKTMDQVTSLNTTREMVNTINNKPFVSGTTATCFNSSIYTTA